jgi:type IV pilus assembly protein PilM
MDVLLVAAKKDMINDYTSVVREAGLTPTVVDVDAFAVQNAFEVNYDRPGETVVLINVGASVVNINVIASNGITTFTRDIAHRAATSSPTRSRSSSTSRTTRPRRSRSAAAARTDSVVPQEVERVMQQVSETIANDVQRSLDFYAATAADATINRIYLSGGCAKVPALSKAIEAKTGVPVEELDPFRQIDIGARGLDPNFLKMQAPLATVAVGLALRCLRRALIRQLTTAATSPADRRDQEKKR